LINDYIKEYKRLIKDRSDELGERVDKESNCKVRQSEYKRNISQTEQKDWCRYNQLFELSRKQTRIYKRFNQIFNQGEHALTCAFCIY